MKRSRFVLPIVGVVLVLALFVLLFALPSFSSNRIQVTNTGTDVVEVKSDCYENKVSLGPNGIGYFDCDSKIQIGDAILNFGRRVEIENMGSDIIQIIYNNTAGSEHKLILGEGGIGYVSKSVLFKIGDANIRLSDLQ
jgi:hypothetical protein